MSSPSHTWNPPFFSMKLNLSTPCSRFDPSFSRRERVKGAANAHFESLPSHNLVIWTNESIPFGKGGSGALANYDYCSLGAPEAALFFSGCPIRSDFTLKPAPFCKLSLASCHSDFPLVSPTPTSWSLLFSATPFGLWIFAQYSVLSSMFLFTSISQKSLAGSVFFLVLYHQATMGTRTLISSWKRQG